MSWHRGHDLVAGRHAGWWRVSRVAFIMLAKTRGAVSRHRAWLFVSTVSKRRKREGRRKEEKAEGRKEEERKIASQTDLDAMCAGVLLRLRAGKGKTARGRWQNTVPHRRAAGSNIELDSGIPVWYVGRCLYTDRPPLTNKTKTTQNMPGLRLRRHGLSKHCWAYMFGAMGVVVSRAISA